ncbi:30S ribosomal protein S1, partial [Candidatus Fermentibacterales bacterium]|nr:30S ribosomal protein S1 [Candidatus Fermentibacterales bacterium]
WTDIKSAYDKGTVLKGTVAKRIKGGLVVRIMGVDAFLPGSQVALRQVPNLEKFISEELEFRVIKLNKRRRNIVVSRRQVLEEARSEQKAKLIKDLEEGQVREGVVKNITDFGAFVDLGGIDGLLHITDMSWGRVKHPSHLVSIGDEIQVKVLKFDRERERISLGLKQLQPFPWEGVEDRYKVGSVVSGKVASITDYGAFVELEEGVEGLIHISEMSWTQHIKHPSKVLGMGEEVEAVVLYVSEEERKISLGLKQTQENPWDTIEERYPIGSVTAGIVRNLTNFGAFVQIEEGIDGLVHISDLSWTKRINHPSEMLSKSETVDVVVLSIDKENHRISLGLKQTQENPWTTMQERLPEGTEIHGSVVQLLDRGVVVDLGDCIEGFVPLSQLGWENLSSPSDVLRTGDDLPLRVIEVVPTSRRIVLSVRSYFNGRPMEELSEFRERLESRPPLEQQATASKPEPSREADSYSEQEGMSEETRSGREDVSGDAPEDVAGEEEAPEPDEEQEEAAEEEEEAPPVPDEEQEEPAEEDGSGEEARE